MSNDKANKYVFEAINRRKSIYYVVVIQTLNGASCFKPGAVQDTKLKL